MGFFKKFTNKLTAPEASVQIVLSNYSVSLGENLQGNLNVTSKEDFETTEVRCELACTEQAKVIREVYDAALKRSIPRVVDESVVIYCAKPTLSGPTHFTNGENRNIPINFNIPAGAKPTYTGVDRRITWTIKGVLAVDGRPDRTTETCEIQVIAPTVQTQAVTLQKEVIRTVVMIPCRYCQGLMDQTLTVCPNCGAKRTI
jgi:sporulation-control protein spo0M